MKKNNYKILVLSDLNGDTSSILKSTISLAKMIGGDINFFHVKSASDIVEKDNQLSAMRVINKEYTAINKQIQNLINPVSKEYDTSIPFVFSFGNIKDEIEKHIKESQPDIIVLGKKKSNPFNFIGDRITEFVLKVHSGVIMIASNKNGLQPNQEIALGILNDLEPSSNLEFAEDLIGNSLKPLKSFNIVTKEELQPSSNEKTVAYVFERNDNSIKNVSNYVSKNNINLLCINRKYNDAINKLNVSILVSN
tara:strand:- start:19967 stop:20719 length:753 start_codon:yes stop_codon:yes gene_type:complete